MNATDPLATVLAYHEQTKHRLDRYARGPETLDWDGQPDPFRRYAGAPLEMLPLTADTVAVTWTQLFQANGVAARPLNRTSIGLLLELSFALSAWKRHGPEPLGGALQSLQRQPASHRAYCCCAAPPA